MEGFVPRPLPELPPYMIRLKPLMTSEEEAEHERRHLAEVAEALKDYSVADIKHWCVELEKKGKAARTALINILARAIVRELRAERDQVANQNPEGRE